MLPEREIAVDIKPVVAAPSKAWPESHPRIALTVLAALGIAFIVWTALAGTVDYFADWF